MVIRARQRRAVTNDGATIKRLPGSLLRGHCGPCDCDVYVESNVGAMVCPHCCRRIPAAQWGRLASVWVPEGRA